MPDPVHSSTVHFSTVLSPHRSLSPEGFRWLIRGAVAANVLIGIPIFVFGAWPVFGFMGLDVLLLYWLFKQSYLDARRSETLVLTDRELIVQRRAPDGEGEEHRLDAYWLRIEAGERLTLVSRGNRIVVGRFLSPAERAELADALRAAHTALRDVRYRNDSIDK